MFHCYHQSILKIIKYLIIEMLEKSVKYYPLKPETRTSQAGFGFTLMAVVLALVMGLIVSMFLRQVSTQVAEMGDLYSASQAKWASVSGIEYGLFKAEFGEADVSGSYSFYNSTIILDTLEAYTTGGALPDYWYMVTSRGSTSVAYRDFRFLSKKSLKTIWGDVSIIEGTADIELQSGFTLNDSLYIGQDVTVDVGADVGSTVFSHIYRPPDHTVTPATGTNYTSGEHYRSWLFSPDFDTEPYDSLIAIALGISSNSVNKFKKNKLFKNDVIDLNSYPDSTIYCRQSFTFQGCTITGGDSTRPAVIVAWKDIVLESTGGNETTIGDNVVLISDDDIYLYDQSEFGLDYSHLSPENRPRTFNMMFGDDYIFVDEDVVAWSQAFSTDDIRIDGALYGIAYAPDKFTFANINSYFEGAIFANKYRGSNFNDLDFGELNLNHYFHEDYFKTYDYGVRDNSLLEF